MAYLLRAFDPTKDSFVFLTKESVTSDSYHAMALESFDAAIKLAARVSIKDLVFFALARETAEISSDASVPAWRRKALAAAKPSPIASPVNPSGKPKPQGGATVTNPKAPTPRSPAPAAIPF